MEIKRITISKVHSVSRKQRRGLAGIEVFHSGLESLFAKELGTCMNVFIISLKTGVKNDVFWFEIESGFEEPGGTPTPRIPKSTSPPNPPRVIKDSLSSSSLLITSHLYS